MASTVGFWFGWFWAAFRTMPEFLGNNWVGFIFAVLVACYYEWVRTSKEMAIRNAPNWTTRLRVLGDFAMKHWATSLGPWILIFSAFWVGHTLDLVRQNSDALTGNKQHLQSTISADDLQCTSDKTDLRIINAAEKARGDALAHQTTTQQASIDNCQTKAISRIKPAPLSLTTDIVDLGLLGTKFGVLAMVISTNQKIQRTTLKLNCPENFTVPAWGYSAPDNGFTYVAAEGRPRTDQHSFPIDLIKPSFDPEKHIVLIMQLSQPKIPYFQCFLDQVPPHET